MGMRERAGWLAHIDKMHIPDHMRRRLRDRVHAFDALLSATLVDLELLYRRTIAYQDEEVEQRVYSHLLAQIDVLAKNLHETCSRLAETQANNLCLRQALAAAEAQVLERAEAARLAAIADGEI